MIIHGNCIDILKTLDDNSVDAVVTDPPYGLGKPPDIAEVLHCWLSGDSYTGPLRKGKRNCASNIVDRAVVNDSGDGDSNTGEKLVTLDIPVSDFAVELRLVDLDDEGSGWEVKVDRDGSVCRFEDLLVDEWNAKVREMLNNGEFHLRKGKCFPGCVGVCSCRSKRTLPFRCVLVRLCDDAFAEPEGSAGVVTSAGAELMAVLAFDALGRPSKLYPACAAFDLDTAIELVRSELVGAGARASGLATVAEADDVGDVGGGADGAFTFRFVSHESVLADASCPTMSQQGFMGAKWDAFVPGPEVWRECMRVLKPGGHLLSFFGTRTYDVGTMAIRIAGFEIRDMVSWNYGCLSEDTEILVDGEWRHYSKAMAGRRALCYNIEDDFFEWREIDHLHVYPVAGQCYRISSDATDQIVTDGHRCIVERDGVRSFELARDIAQEHQTSVPVLEGLPDVLGRFPLPHGRAGDSQQTLRTAVPAPVQADAQVPGAIEDDQNCVCSLQGGKVEAERVAAQGQDADVLRSMQRETPGGGAGQAQSQGPGGMVGGERGREQQAHERVGQSRLARWCDFCAEERSLSGPALGEVPGGVHRDGEARRVHYGTSACSCSGAGPGAAELGSCAPHGSQDARQRDREPRIVCEQLGPHEIPRARNTRTTMARVEPCDYAGPVWCVTVPTGAFVARRNGKVFVTGNSGFPKSTDISKRIDKEAGVERGVVGRSMGASNLGAGSCGEHVTSAPDPGKAPVFITAPATPEAKQWQGWGSALKPSLEPICVARKPLEKGMTLAQNVLMWGTGGLNVDGCRVGTESTLRPLGGRTHWGTGSGGMGGSDSGRWPANFVHDGSDEVMALFPETKSGAGSGHHKRHTGGGNGRTHGAMAGVTGPIRESNSGSAARFFKQANFGPTELEDLAAARFMYCPKASKKERDHGLDSMQLTMGGERAGGRKEGSAGLKNPRAGTNSPGRCTHPTVKPIALMRWLVRLVTPPGGTVLDPFCGSGTTGIAAKLEGFEFVGIEMSDEYCELSRARIEAAE
jgi:DNA modification methylase